MGRDLGQPAAHRHGRPVFQLRADPELRAELDYCVPLGVPHSVFTGRVVDPQRGDPAWLPTDRAYALAWGELKRATCPGCGTRADEWAEDDDAYIGDHTYCEGCARLAEEKNNIPRDPEGNPRPGMHTYLAPRELYEAQHADHHPIGT